MTDHTVRDYRRTDLRTNVLENPYWITSGNVGYEVGHDDDIACLLFSFPVAGMLIFIEQVVVEVITAFTAGTTMNVGLYTLATDGVTTGGVGTLVDVDEFMEAADITMTTPGTYQAASATGNDWLTAKVAGVPVAPYCLTGAATTVPVVTCTLINAAAIAAGRCRIHMLITTCPGK